MERWRLIDSGPSGAFFNMAVDEALSLSVRKGQCPPTLRFYGWDRPSVSIGRFQRTDDINLNYCSEAEIPVVRRPTGGRAILHFDELTYSFSSPNEGGFSKGLLHAYRLIGEALRAALLKLGIHAEVERERGRHSPSPLCFHSVSYAELSRGGLKVVGSAQRRWPDGFLQQGSIPFKTDKILTERIFKINNQAGSTGGNTGSGLRLENGDPPTLQSLKDALIESFEEAFSIRLAPGLLTSEEVRFWEELLLRKYQSPLWNQLRRPQEEAAPLPPLP